MQICAHSKLSVLVVCTVGIAFAATGCGTSPTDLTNSGPKSPDATGSDPGSMASTVNDDQFGQFELVARQSSTESSDQWNFAVKAGRQTAKNELRFVWDFGDGNQPEGLEQSRTYSEPGTYTVRVYAYKLDGTLAFVLSLQIQIVSPSNTAPAASAGEDMTVNKNELVFLYAGGSTDPEGDSLSYSWAQVSGTPVQLLDSETVTASFISPMSDADEDLSFRVDVSDGQMSSVASVNVHVSAGQDGSSGTAPIANAGTDQSVREQDTATLDGSGSSGTGSLMYKWEQVSGPSVGLFNGNQQKASFFALDLADDARTDLVFELTVSSGGEFATDQVQISVLGSAVAGTASIPPIGDCLRDSDDDGVPDCRDRCPGIPDIDTDRDGAADCIDECPNDPRKGTPGQCGCGVADTDADHDGTEDCDDGCPADPAKTTPGTCGCGAAEGTCVGSCKISNTTWKNTGFTAQSGTFTVQFDITPTASSMDGVIAFSKGTGNTFSSYSGLIRFNPSGTIDARDGDGYNVMDAVSYAAGRKYHFRVPVDVSSHTYSVYITPPGGSEKTIGEDFAFRVGQDAVASLDNWGMWSDAGAAITVCGFGLVNSPLTANAGSDKTVTTGTATPLTGTASGGQPPYTFIWAPLMELSGAATATPTVTPTATRTYTLIVKDATGLMASDSVVVTVQTASTLVARAGADKTITAGGSAILAGSATGGTPPYTYKWSPATGLSSTTVQSPTASPTATQTYILTVTDSTSQTAQDLMVVTVTAGTSTLTANAGADKSITVGGSTTLQGSASGGTGPYTYRWSPSTGLSSTTAAQPTASPTSTQTYTLTVTDANSQTDTDTVGVTVTTAQTGPAFYVSRGASNASDSNPGTESQPWRTLTKAASAARAGQTVIVKAGTYTEGIRATSSGSPGAMIVFRADPASACTRGSDYNTAPTCGVKIDGSGIDINAKSYIRIEGFEIRNYSGTNDEAGVYCQDRGVAQTNHLEIVNNYIHHGGNGIVCRCAKDTLISDNYISDTGTDAPGAGIGIRGDILASNVQILNNVILRVGCDGMDINGNNILIGENVLGDSFSGDCHQDAFEIGYPGVDGLIVRNNRVFDFTQLVYFPLNDEPGQYAKNVEICGNVMYTNRYWSVNGGEAPGVFFDAQRFDNVVTNINIHSNTFGWLGYGAIWVSAGSGTLSGFTIKNNIFYQSSVDVPSSVRNVVSDNNLYYQVSKPSFEGSHSSTADPKFVDYRKGVAFNFRLQPTSPCIDMGADVNMPKDIAGGNRPSNGRYDLGAYEYGN